MPRHFDHHQLCAQPGSPTLAHEKPRGSPPIERSARVYPMPISFSLIGAVSLPGLGGPRAGGGAAQRRKAGALNTGIATALGDILVLVDGDIAYEVPA